MIFKLTTAYKPAGDQQVIDGVCSNLSSGLDKQIILGVTGSGKTYTVANIIKESNRPALILAPNKTLAAQLYGEVKSFSQKMLLNILYHTMTTISLRLM